MRDEPARGHVEQVGSRLDRPARDRRDVVDGEAAGCGVSRGEAYEHGHAVAGLGAHLAHDLEDEARAVLEGSAVLVLAHVRERREELVQQVAVRRVHLRHLEAGAVRAHGGGREGGDQLGDLGGRQLEHALFARLRGQLLAYQHELLRGELCFAFDFLEELLEFLVGDCHFCSLDCLCRCLLLVVQLIV